MFLANCYLPIANCFFWLKVLVYQHSSAQISGKKLVFLLVAAMLRCDLVVMFLANCYLPIANCFSGPNPPTPMVENHHFHLGNLSITAKSKEKLGIGRSKALA
jgi:hypothetical protein